MAEPTNEERAAWAPPTNKDRAAWAQQSIETYRLVTGGGEQCEAISDLIADLCHLAVRYGQDPRERLQMAFEHYTHDLVDEAEVDITLTYQEFRILMSEFSDEEKSRFGKDVQEFIKLGGRLTRVKIEYNRVAETWLLLKGEH